MSDESADEAAAKQPGRRADRRVKPVARSRVGNGKVLIAGIDTHSRDIANTETAWLILSSTWDLSQRRFNGQSSRKQQD
jgi:hypothetical protein